MIIVKYYAVVTETENYLFGIHTKIRIFRIILRNIIDGFAIYI
jgi:hypothetical protein